MNVLEQLFNILSWPVYLCVVRYLPIIASILTGYWPVMVLNGSVEPTFPVGNVIYYKVAPLERIQRGDPITPHAGEASSPVTHRVVEKQELNRDFITRGDANKTTNPNPVSYGRMAGRASGVKIPYAGYFVTYDRTPQAIEVVGGILMIEILLDFICPGKRREEKA